MVDEKDGWKAVFSVFSLRFSPQEDGIFLQTGGQHMNREEAKRKIRERVAKQLRSQPGTTLEIAVWQLKIPDGLKKEILGDILREHKAAKRLQRSWRKRSAKGPRSAGSRRSARSPTRKQTSPSSVRRNKDAFERYANAVLAAHGK